MDLQVDKRNINRIDHSRSQSDHGIYSPRNMGSHGPSTPLAAQLQGTSCEMLENSSYTKRSSVFF